ncbi:hypothetical protein [Pukyongiella litopenaei]|uniref:Uncharacterized protein n=1 Tax=Pukyongiella litopenaei TaxID=2605946 RepID=A0A2S0ML22_9RHOB|nr:hypothetical protein [Pukyongiella litopenaei]AVO36585.1 hypothetical protein C6Y53_01965 [Pukyongiella litopenaei]
MNAPIFFAWTRSFWAGLIAILSSLSTIDPTALRTVVSALAGDEWAHVAVEAAPLVAAACTALVMQQRGGASRPYTVDPRARR